MSIKFSMERDVNGYNAFGLIPSTDDFSGLLLAGVAQTVTVPTNKDIWTAIFEFEPGATIWVAHNTTAAAPTTTIARSHSELNPTVWMVKAGDTISFITSDDSDEFGVKFYYNSDT